MTMAADNERTEAEAGRHIFLSYGHRDLYAFARKLRTDLEDHGHQVWLDQTELLPGRDWEAHIDDGISAIAAAGGRGCMILLMTPASVQPESYCLNEIARALERHIDIIPIMLLEVSPPLSICRIQWLDLRDCRPVETHREQYEAKLDLLLRALCEGLERTGVHQRLFAALQPLDYRMDIKRHLPHFTGRRWFLDAFTTWCDDPDGAKVFWLCGPPGSGKSAIAAWLCDQRPEIVAYHICKHDHEQKADPGWVIRSLAWQLTTQLPPFFARLSAIPDLEELCSHRDLGRHGSRALTLFDRLLVQPSNAISDPGKTLVLLIDGLDEATQGERNPLADFLADEAESLPSWLRVMVTSRPDPEVSAPLQRLTPFLLDADSAANRADVESFIDTHLVGEGRNLDPSVRRTIIAYSENNWLYLEWLRIELEQGRLSLDDPQAFPAGLGGVYLDFFQRRFPDLRDYKRSFRPLLDLLVVAYEPLSTALAAEVLGWGPADAEDVREAFGSLLLDDPDYFRAYHRSVKDWLADPARSGRYRASAAQGHHVLGRWSWAEYERGIPDMADYALRHLPKHLRDMGADDRLECCLVDVEYIAHRAQRDPNRIYELGQFWSLDDAAARCHALRASFAACVERGLDTARLHEMAGAAGRLLRHLGHYTDAMALFDRSLEFAAGQGPQVVGAAEFEVGWCLRHMERFDEAIARLERALACFDAVDDPGGRGHCLSAKGMCLWHRYRDLPAIACLEQALACFEQLGDLRGQAEAHNHVGIVERSLGRFGPAHRHLREAMALYEKLRDQKGLGKCFNSIGTACWWAGEIDRALDYYTRADAINRRYNQRYVEGLTANNLGYVHLERGDLARAGEAFERARALRQTIASHGYEMLDVSGLARVRFEAGEIERARALSDEALRGLEGVETLEDLRRAYYNHYLIWRDEAPEQASRALARARALAQRRLEHIDDASVREQLVSGVPLMRELTCTEQGPT